MLARCKETNVSYYILADISKKNQDFPLFFCDEKETETAMEEAGIGGKEKYKSGKLVEVLNGGK